MNLHKRRIIAYIIGIFVGEKEVIKVYDKTYSSFNMIAGEVSQSRINVFDTERNEMITGTADGKGISLYDYATAKFIDLKISGEQFEGFDYESNKIFYGDLKENTVSIFDFQDSKHHYYILMAENESITENLGLLI